MDTDTTIAGNYYRVKITPYSNTLGELSFWYDEPLGRESRREAQLYPSPRKTDQDQTDREDNTERAVRRAKSKARKLTMTMQADRMLTLTTRANIEDRKEADKLFVRFIKAVHRAYPKWQYVATAERQKRGAWHYHIAVKGFQDVAFLRAAWRKLVDGNIDVTSPRSKGNRDKAAAIIASYITKYLTKAFTEGHDPGRYRYRASNGIALKTVQFWMRAQDWRQAIAEAAELMEALFDGVGSTYFSDDWLNAWFASWAFNKSRKRTR